MMTKDGVLDHGGSPTGKDRPDFIDPIPAHLLGEWEYVLKTCPPISPTLGLDAGSSNAPLAPLAASPFKTAAARHPQAPVASESP
jgi:hypothetical protein